MMDLVIFFPPRRPTGGFLQCRFPVLLAELFDVWGSRNGIGIEPLAIEFAQGFTVCGQPRLHHLHHQMVVLRTNIRQIPAITPFPVCLWPIIHRTFRVD